MHKINFQFFFTGIDFVRFIEESHTLKELELTAPEREQQLKLLSEKLSEAILHWKPVHRRILGWRSGGSMGAYVSVIFFSKNPTYFLVGYKVYFKTKNFNRISRIQYIFWILLTTGNGTSYILPKKDFWWCVRGK